MDIKMLRYVDRQVATTYQSARRNILEDWTLQSNSCENLKYETQKRLDFGIYVFENLKKKQHFVSVVMINTLHDGPAQKLSIPKLFTKFTSGIVQCVVSPVSDMKIKYGQESTTVQSVDPTLQCLNTYWHVLEILYTKVMVTAYDCRPQKSIETRLVSRA
jgi:hypothetical protein